MCLGIPGEVLEFTSDEELGRQARVRFGGITKLINMDFAPEARPGDFVIVHVGFAISVVNASEAKKILDTLESLGELHEVSR